MGFPLTDQASTDISRYFYIASKFIENGINSGGEHYADRNVSRIRKIKIQFSFLSFLPLLSFLSFARIKSDRQSPRSLHGWNVSLSDMRSRLSDDFAQNVSSGSNSNRSNAP